MVTEHKQRNKKHDMVSPRMHFAAVGFLSLSRQGQARGKRRLLGICRQRVYVQLRSDMGIGCSFFHIRRRTP